MLTADTTAADLLAYVVTHPEETDCRLVYADLLEERGEDARAEFIRVQCELARWERLAIDRDSAPLPALRRRGRELLNAAHDRVYTNQTAWSETVRHLV